MKEKIKKEKEKMKYYTYKKIDQLNGSDPNHNIHMNAWLRYNHV